MSVFAFVQFEYPFALGPGDGRYVLRGHAGQASHVLVLNTLGAAERRRLLARRSSKAKAAEPEPEPTAVVTTRATLVQAEPLADAAAAKAWVKTANLSAEVDEAIEVVNEVIHAHRTAAMDPYVREVNRAQALVIRAGVGDGEAVAHGRWSEAVELASPPKPLAARRAGLLRPQERFAAILSGRDVALACEELILRARLDIDAGRGREAALQLRIALEAALAELAPWASSSDLGTRLEELRSLRGDVGDAANTALQGGLDDATTAEVGRIIGRVEAALRVRTTIGLE